jgi:hypothetical protein
MKSLLLTIFGLLAWIGCEDPKDSKEESRQVEALLVDAIQIDGCAAHFEVSSGDTTLWYGASEATEKLVTEFLRKETSQYGVFSIPVRVRLRETFGLRTIQCGWGATRATDEIEVLAIQKR